MKAKTLEASLLRPAEELVRKFECNWPSELRQEARFQLLEAVASRLGGFKLEAYFAEFEISCLEVPSVLLQTARDVIAKLDPAIPPALAVSALAREALSRSDQRISGAYHTDFRLALHLANSLAPLVRCDAKVIDPACGAGMLLAALTVTICGADRTLTSGWLANCVYAADLSPGALRGALLSLACLTDEIPALREMRDKWRIGDSLLQASDGWGSTASGGFDVVIANPPWEKLKITRHEFIQEEGGERHYGADYVEFDEAKYSRRKSGAKAYENSLVQRYWSLQSGEPDLYLAFTELAFELAKSGGHVALILPAGLIRSKNTESLRRHLFDQSDVLDIDILENRARFFPIDTRFKFLTVLGTKHKSGRPQSALRLRHSYGVNSGVRRGAVVQISRPMLRKIRADLSIPEVKSEAEWALFTRLASKGHDWSQANSLWHPHFSRELDMTRDKRHFQRAASELNVPLIEGRMVHQHRIGAKSHIAGTGRSAVWSINPPGVSKIAPQFWIVPSDMSAKTQERFNQKRAGFCDITGQTNERSMLAAMILPGQPCGNKVPTMLFINDMGDDRLWLWIAIANSIPFDWMIRRIITTTVNYFHLLSLPLPAIEPDTLPGRQLVEFSKELARLDSAGYSSNNLWKIAELRAKADQAVAAAYGLQTVDLALMLEDFPLIDRAQPPLPGEKQSTVTRDALLANSKCPDTAAVAKERLKIARQLGAVPYLPSESASIKPNTPDRLTGSM